METPKTSTLCMAGKKHNWQYVEEPFTHDWWVCKNCKFVIETNTGRTYYTK